MDIPEPRAAGEDLLVAVVLDRSGSMQAMRREAIEAFNELLGDLQKQSGVTRFTLVQFSTAGLQIVADGVPVAEVVPLTDATYLPGGGTPLYDAIGETLARTEAFVSSEGWTGSVLVAIVTDGHENASREWSKQAVLGRVKELEARGWAFIYLGATTNAYDEAASIGVAAGSTARWTPRGKNVKAVGKGLAEQASRYRKGLSDRASLVLESERAEMEDDR